MVRMFLSVQSFLQCHTTKLDFYQTTLVIKAWNSENQMEKLKVGGGC